MNFEVKIVRPLAQFKNLKFFRLIYPVRRHNSQQQTSSDVKSNRRKLRLNLNKQTKIKTLDIDSVAKAESKSPSVDTLDTEKKKKLPIPLKRRYILMGNHTKRFAKLHNKSINTTYTKKNTYLSKKEANIFKRMRRKELLAFSQSRIYETRKKLMMRNFTPIASLFIKYLNPQLLADHIAKELEKTKHHRNVLYNLSTALRSLPFARAKGYHISITGRINSADRSRIFLLKRNVLSRQNFSTKVNYATSQARARIGSIGIKV